MPKREALSKNTLAVMLGLVTLLAAGLWFSRNRVAPAEETRQDLESVKTAVLAYAKENGSAPPDLAALVNSGHLPEMPTDRSGNAFVYTVSEDGAAIAVKSLGPDGKEGGFMFKRDHAVQFEVPDVAASVSE